MNFDIALIISLAKPASSCRGLFFSKNHCFAQSDCDIVQCFEAASVWFLWKSVTGGRNKTKQGQEDKASVCLINDLMWFFLCTFCFSQLPESELLGNRFDEHDWEKISNIHVSWEISWFFTSDTCVPSLENYLTWSGLHPLFPPCISQS